MNLDSFLDMLADYVMPPSVGPFCNPYSAEHNTPDLDIPGGAAVRLANAKAYFHAFPEPPAVLLLGEAPGPWGARFSGVAFTSESQLESGELPFKGERTSTFHRPCIEKSGAIMWRKTLPFWPRVLHWNAVPFHPYLAGDRLSIRTPSQAEVRMCLPILDLFLEVAQPRAVVAVGRKAESACRELDVPATYVRHPSMGGEVRFSEGFAALSEPGGPLA